MGIQYAYEGFFGRYWAIEQYQNKKKEGCFLSILLYVTHYDLLIHVLSQLIRVKGRDIMVMIADPNPDPIEYKADVNDHDPAPDGLPAAPWLAGGVGTTGFCGAGGVATDCGWFGVAVCGRGCDLFGFPVGTMSGV